VTLEGPASHPLVPLFEEFIFQNLAVTFGSSFLVHLSKTVQDFRVGGDGLKMNSQNLLPDSGRWILQMGF